MPLGQPRRLIVSRTDNIGDVVLTLPLAGLVKERWPDTEVVLLARDYVAPVAAACPSIDRFVSWDPIAQLPRAQRGETLRCLGGDAVVHAFPDRAIAAAARPAGITARVGTVRRWWHLWTCTHRVSLTRRGSPLHEAQLNVRLLEPWGMGREESLASLIPRGRLSSNGEAARRIEGLVDPRRFSLVLHPGSKGNGREWPGSFYARLIERLPAERIQVLVTGTAEERARLGEVFAAARPVDDLTGRLDLAELIGLLSRVDGMIASGTGPLHLSAALGRRTLGLFPSVEGTVGTARWRPLGERATVLTGRAAPCRCPGPAACDCMRSVDVDRVLAAVERWVAE